MVARAVGLSPRHPPLCPAARRSGTSVSEAQSPTFVRSFTVGFMTAEDQEPLEPVMVSQGVAFRAARAEPSVSLAIAIGSARSRPRSASRYEPSFQDLLPQYRSGP